MEWLTIKKKSADAIIDMGMWSKEKDAEKTVNRGVFDKKSSIMCNFYAKCFVAQNKYITFEPRNNYTTKIWIR